eukprot:NODE_3382_length_1361_cov_10.554927_g2945_i0.p1 GENE.NODE_3382_length_1361_cov_10.554927_g2945_i0~~NODE_3382_length_1361_cov_10.554927_g2945_i0.p1  ORF type:complete len:350 (+),score=56.86 NODE_3382_length_1361_cov_10.554927_g2945_i0:31-1050(+)
MDDVSSYIQAVTTHTKQLLLFMQSLPVPVLVVDSNFTISYANRSSGKLLGLEPYQLISKSLTTYLPLEILLELPTSLPSHVPCFVENRQTTLTLPKNNERIPVDVSLVCTIQPDNSWILFVLIQKPSTSLSNSFLISSSMNAYLNEFMNRLKPIDIENKKEIQDLCNKIQNFGESSNNSVKFTLNADVFNSQSTIALPKKWNVLVADDIIVNQRIMARMLQQGPFEGLEWKIDLANTGEEVLELYKLKRYHLITLDEDYSNTGGMMSGREVCKKLRQYEKENGLPRCIIIGATSMNSPSYQKEALDLGQDIVWSKPYPSSQVMALNICDIITVRSATLD